MLYLLWSSFLHLCDPYSMLQGSRAVELAPTDGHGTGSQEVEWRGPCHSTHSVAELERQPGPLEPGRIPWALETVKGVITCLRVVGMGLSMRTALWAVLPRVTGGRQKAFGGTSNHPCFCFCLCACAC